MTSPSELEARPGDETMEIRLNGTRRTIPAGTTLLALLVSMDREPQTVAVEHNGDILARSLYASTVLASGDRVEVVQFVQGG